MKTSDFDFQLPEELIAQTPLERRDASRLLTLDRESGAVGHHHFYDLPRFLRPGDCLVLNDSRVLRSGSPPGLSATVLPEEPVKYFSLSIRAATCGSVWSVRGGS